MGFFAMFDTDTHEVVPKGAIVLDLSEFPVAQHQIATTIRTLLRETERNGWETRALERVADQIESQTRPPRIPEPGLWGVVEARLSPTGATLRFGRTGDDAWMPENAAGRPYLYKWSDLIDPVLVREGL